jgi:hypothetical protein
VTKDNTKGQFFIRDRKVIENVLLPIFDKYPLLTTKYFDYMKLKKALDILNNINIDVSIKNTKLLALKNEKAPKGYISPAWNNTSLPLKSVNSVINIMYKP